MTNYKIIQNLSNEAYHGSPEYATYLSSTQLKRYLKSPKAARCRFRLSDNGVDIIPKEEEKTDSMRLGSLFHSFMEQCAKHCDNRTQAVAEWMREISVFEPPTKDNGKPWGNTSKAYKEAYDTFLQANENREIYTEAEITQINAMGVSLVGGESKTAEQVRKLLKWAKEAEVSYFYENDDGIKLKIRPDLLTRDKLVDWKTTSLESLDEDDIAKAIIKYGYHISLAMYQYVLHEIHGKWYTPILVFVQSKEPYDSVMVDISEWCYSYDETIDFVSMGVGALEFKRLLDLHTKCTKENNWPGIEYILPADDRFKIMKPEIPTWYGMKIMNK